MWTYAKEKALFEGLLPGGCVQMCWMLGSGGGTRTLDLAIMSRALLPAELHRQVLGATYGAAEHLPD